jgi:hypothetical protein
MPATLDIRPLSRHPEPGVNLDLHRSMDEVLRHGEEIAMWGPFEVRHTFYYRFQVQKTFLESGTIGYQCIDTWGESARKGNGCDCIHAITDMDPEFGRGKYPLYRYGQAGSKNIVRQLHDRSMIISPVADHGWLISALALEGYPIERKAYNGRRVIEAAPEHAD